MLFKCHQSVQKKILHLFEEPFVMQYFVAQPLNGRGDDSGLTRVPDADRSHVREAENL